MDNSTIQLVLTIFTAATSLVAAVTSLLGTYREKEMRKVRGELSTKKKELYHVYKNVRQLCHIESDLLSELGKSKTTFRKNYETDRYIEPKHVESRIRELDEELGQ